MKFQWVGFILPLIGWLGCFYLCRELAARQKIDSDRRFSLALASVAWGVLVVGITELLSASALLSRPGVVIGWCSADVILVGAWVRLAKRRAPLSRLFRDECTHYQLLMRGLRSDPSDLRLMALAIALLAAFLGCVALLTPSTNWDSLTYHLPRVMHWIQQRSVEVDPNAMSAQVTFKDLPQGSYAVSVLHDENGNGKMDKNFVGMPKEGL